MFVCVCESEGCVRILNTVEPTEHTHIHLTLPVLFASIEFRIRLLWLYQIILSFMSGKSGDCCMIGGLVCLTSSTIYRYIWLVYLICVYL